MSQAFNDASNASYASQQGNAMSSQGPQQVPTFPPQPAPYPESPQPYGYGQPRGTWQQPQYAPGFAPYGQGYGMPQYPQQPYPPQQPYEPWPGYGSQPPAGYAEQARPQAQAPAPQPAEQGYVPQPRPYQPQQGYAAQQEYEPRPYGQQAYAPQASYGRPAFEPQPPAAPQQDREPMPDGAAKPPAQQPYEPQPAPRQEPEAPAEASAGDNQAYPTYGNENGQPACGNASAEADATLTAAEEIRRPDAPTESTADPSDAALRSVGVEAQQYAAAPAPPPPARSSSQDLAPSVINPWDEREPEEAESEAIPPFDGYAPVSAQGVPPDEPAEVEDAPSAKDAASAAPDDAEDIDADIASFYDTELDEGASPMGAQANGGFGCQLPAAYAEQSQALWQDPAQSAYRPRRGYAPVPQTEQGYVPQPRPYQPQQGYAAQQEYEPRPYGQQAYAPQASYGRPAFEPQPPAAPQQDREPMPDGAAKPPAQQPYEPQRGYVPQPQGAREAPAENGVETKTEPPQPASDGADAEDKSRSRLKYVLIGLGASVAFLVAVGGGMLLMSQVADGAAPANNAAPAKVEAVQSASSGEGSESTPQAETARAEVSASSDEDHKWTDLVQTVHHEAEIEKVHHDAVTQDVTEYHTVCNDCGETVDGVAADHIASTGHSGYTQGVPVTVTKTIAEAFDEEIKKSEPYDEQKVVGRYCADCGTVEMYPEG